MRSSVAAIVAILAAAAAAVNAAPAPAPETAVSLVRASPSAWSIDDPCFKNHHNICD
ncbi:hypothetical protein DFJ73DRAFT_778534 [Zopfochytrium polystomum]|nr:hypothetical protein DFJ73DRAFT_778534 [Zopfochytrium polystomum]